MTNFQLTPLEVLNSFPPHDGSLYSFFASRCDNLPDRQLLGGEITAWTYKEASHASASLAASLGSMGIAKGDRVVMVSLNSDIVALLFLALARIGAVFVPINPALTINEMSYVLGHCEPRLVVAQDDVLAQVLGVAQGIAAPPTVVAASMLDLRGLPAALAEPAPAGGDPLVMIYTSGTTGFPKGVVHSHQNFVLAAEAFVERLHLQPGERQLAILPFFHINALFYSFGGAIACGGTLLTTPRFSASRFWHLAATHHATQLNILAAVGNILAKRPRSEYNASHRIRKIYGGPISPDMMEAFQHEFGVTDLIEGFGMSEVPGAFNNPFDGPRKIGSIGKPSRHPRLPEFAQAKVVDDDLAEVPDGVTGELLIRTPISMVEYFRDPQQTRDAYADGWLKTGDLAKRDADGYFYFIARKKDIIRRRGENISGAELDRVIGAHPDVLEVATIGVPALLGDEDILAVIVPRTSPPPSPQAIVTWCNSRLAAMKVPRFITFVDRLPHTASQRITKFALKQDQSLRIRAWDREAQP